MAKKPLICGNWKLNYGLAETRAELGAMLGEANHLVGVDLAIAPVATVLGLAAETVGESRWVSLHKTFTFRNRVLLLVNGHVITSMS